MATFPSKANYVTGEVLTATNMNDIGGAINLLDGAQFAAGKNKIINGDFGINQRAFTTTTTTGYMFDRFASFTSDGTVTYSAQTFTPGTAPVAGYESKNFLRCVTTGQTATSAAANVSQKIESVRTFAGQTVTISFWAKAGSGTPKVAVEFQQQFGSGGSPSSSVGVYAGQVTLSTSWARYSLTVAVPSIAGKTIGTTNDGACQLVLWYSAGSDFNSRTGSLGIQSNTFDVWGVQTENTSTASNFQTATGTIQGELAACQRYFYLSASGTGKPIGNGNNNSATLMRAVIPFPVTMRTTPTVVAASGTDYYLYQCAAANDTFNSITLGDVSTNAISVFNNTEISGTAGQGGLILTNNASASLAFSAEL
jgi:hypothetical protein